MKAIVREKFNTALAEIDNAPLIADRSEDALALEYARLFSDQLRYCSGRGWMRLDGGVWRTDDRLLHFTLARRLLRNASEGLDEKKADAISSARTVNAVAHLARSDERIIVTPDMWDADAGVLNTPLGVVDLSTGDVRRMTSSDHVSKITNAAPQKVPTPTWSRFLNEVFLGDSEVVHFVQLLLGYCLTGYTREQKLFFLRGSGANGKSTLMDVVEWIFGDYARKLPSDALMQSKQTRHPTELAQLAGVRLASSSELEDSQYWAEARIKELTGDETLTARFMHRDFFTFRQSQKHIVCGNYRPRLKGGDYAMQRRMVLIPFDATFQGAACDPDLPNKLRAEAGGILHWMIQGAVEWHNTGLVIPVRISTASKAYMDEMDDIAQWVEDCCDLGPTIQESTSVLYASFRHWKRDRNEHPTALQAWRERLLQHEKTLRPMRTNRQRGVSGIALCDAERRHVEGIG